MLMLALNMVSTGQGPEMNSFYQGQKSDPKPVIERPASNDAKSHDHHEQDMELGYEDAQQSENLGGLHQKFMDEIMKLMKEEQDAENEENARYLKRVREIDDQYQDKLSTMRARHRNHLEGFLRREAQMHQEQYQRSIRSQYQHGSMGTGDIHNYGGSLGEGHQDYPTRAYDAYRAKMPPYGNASHPHARNPAFDAWGPYPGSRVYDHNPRYL